MTMVRISLAQLCERLGRDLRPHDGARVARRDLTGVHISELDDPTPYLGGGELLLTTGIPLSGGADRTGRYVQRLLDKGVAALGLGLGAGIDEVPDELDAVCREAGLALLIVPDGIPFMHVSRAYWDLVGRAEQADLTASLSRQTSLARAATRPEAVASVVKALAEALGGWAVYVPADGTAETIWPPAEARVLPQLREETARLGLAGTHASATFPLQGTDVVEYSIVADEKTAGFLAVGAGRPLRAADRQLMLTGCMLLSVTAGQQWGLRRANAILGGTVASLILHGYVDAARLAAEELGLPVPAERVRLLAVRGDQVELLGDAELADRVAALGPAGRALRRSIRRSGLQSVLDGLTWLILDEAQGEANGEARGEANGETDGELHGEPAPLPLAGPGGTTVATTAATTGALSVALSGPLLLGQVAGSITEVGRACRRAASGQLVSADGLLDQQADGWVDALRSYTRADLVETVRCYLRHRGQWEPTARELGVHRNSLRHRIGIASRLVEADLDDPDVAANLWLALRG
ncbi:PucR family transcriptional regulator [Cryobacterium tagatosivorans]|uniref:PucR family transcriptional regulator n=1 Tax=Cryobacterium tagatosivorans TaxID=1259199 RepID=A0A4R8UAF6_9MICO|nr:PucR family transcriptional regulator [Cryobacterium tagatosivorans]TFB47010.1 PucR family transcriptional regulator [Cryobacterium tagatosivorans]